MLIKTTKREYKCSCGQKQKLDIYQKDIGFNKVSFFAKCNSCFFEMLSHIVDKKLYKPLGFNKDDVVKISNEDGSVEYHELISDPEKRDVIITEINDEKPIIQTNFTNEVVILEVGENEFIHKDLKYIEKWVPEIGELCLFSLFDCISDSNKFELIRYQGGNKKPGDKLLPYTGTMFPSLKNE